MLKISVQRSRNGVIENDELPPVKWDRCKRSFKHPKQDLRKCSVKDLLMGWLRTIFQQSCNWIGTSDRPTVGKKGWLGKIVR